MEILTFPVCVLMGVLGMFNLFIESVDNPLANVRGATRCAEVDARAEKRQTLTSRTSC